MVRIATLTQPLAMAVRSDDAALYVAEKGGRVVAIRGGTIDPTPVLDISSKVSNGGEQGLLGIAFSPDGQYLYVSYTDVSGNTNIVQYSMGGGRSVVGSARRVLFVSQPYANHNGGNIAFGPDGDLYLAGRAGVRPEIWAYGLRNPWRFSFDRLTGDLWIGDVGQNTWEEVDFQADGSKGGQNYGWSCFEGDHGYKSCRPKNAVGPINEYNHDTGGCVVTGGYVYRGSAIPDLEGAYVFADYCSGVMTALAQSGGRIVQKKVLATKLMEVDLFPRVLADVPDPEISRQPVEGEPPRVAQAVRPDLRTDPGSAGESGSETTIGTPVSPPARRSGISGIWPSRGTPRVSAASRPPPSPKIAVRSPQWGQMKNDMFSITPHTWRRVRSAIFPARSATFRAASCGVVTTSI